MAAITKWPDFLSASKLRSLMGSQSSAPEATTPDETSSPPLARAHREQRIDRMADLGDGQFDEMEGVEGFGSNGAAIDADDADFGDLELFDSNASQAPFSSQAPLAPRSDKSAAPTPTGSAKRDKRKQGKGARTSDSAVAGQIPGETRKTPKRKYLQESPAAESHPTNGSLAGQDPNQTPVAGAGASQASAEADGMTSGRHADELATVPSTQTKKKRKLSDPAESRRRKKRKPQDPIAEDMIQGTPDGDQRPGSPDTHAAAAFLRLDEGAGGKALGAVMEDGAADCDEQISPSVARLRRRSQSREVRSRESSVPFRADVAPMGIAVLPRATDHRELLAGHIPGAEEANDDQTNGPSPEMAACVSDADGEVESLAREAWRDHVNSQNVGKEDVNALPLHGPSTVEAPENPALQEAKSNPSPKKRRSTRTTKKPTFFEQTAEDAPVRKNRRALETYPSSSANKSPQKPRDRAKRAAKSAKPPTPKPKMLSQPTAGDLDEAEEEERRNRSDGYKRGRFTDEELARISRAVESFRDDNDLTQIEVNEMIHTPGGTAAGNAHAELWVRLVAECPDRRRQKVLNIARKKFHNFIARGTWTPEQDAELSALIDVNGTAWSKIAAIINRHPEDVRDRYRNYIVCGPSQRRDVWDNAEEARLTAHVKEAMEVIDELRHGHTLNAMLHKPYEELIDWQNISEKMDRTRSRLQCITKWKAMQNRPVDKKSKSRSRDAKSEAAEANPNVSDEEISSQLDTARQQLASMHEEEQYRLVLAIQSTAATSAAQIPWPNLLDKKFRGQWGRATQVLLWDRLRQTVPDWESKTVQDTAQSIISEYNRTGAMAEVKGSGSDDDGRETELLRQLYSQSTTTNGVVTKGKKPRSAEFVGDSSAEEDGRNRQANKGESNIDPALIQEPSASGQQAAPAKKKGTPKRQSSGKRKSKKATAAAQDPIEDGESAMTLPTVDEVEDSNIDEEQFRKKKKLNRFKALNSRISPDVAVPSPPEAYSDSVMDDMEDLPARIAA